MNFFLKYTQFERIYTPKELQIVKILLCFKRKNHESAYLDWHLSNNVRLLFFLFENEFILLIFKKNHQGVMPAKIFLYFFFFLIIDPCILIYNLVYEPNNYFWVVLFYILLKVTVWVISLGGLILLFCIWRFHRLTEVIILWSTIIITTLYSFTSVRKLSFFVISEQ